VFYFSLLSFPTLSPTFSFILVLSLLYLFLSSSLFLSFSLIVHIRICFSSYLISLIVLFVPLSFSVSVSHRVYFFLTFSTGSLNNSPIRSRTSPRQKWIMTVVFFFAIHASNYIEIILSMRWLAARLARSHFSGFVTKAEKVLFSKKSFEQRIEINVKFQGIISLLPQAFYRMGCGWMYVSSFKGLGCGQLLIFFTRYCGSIRRFQIERQ